jgi:hypothetical protein
MLVPGGYNKPRCSTHINTAIDLYMIEEEPEYEPVSEIKCLAIIITTVDWQHYTCIAYLVTHWCVLESCIMADNSVDFYKLLRSTGNPFSLPQWGNDTTHGAGSLSTSTASCSRPSSRHQAASLYTPSPANTTSSGIIVKYTKNIRCKLFFKWYLVPTNSIKSVTFNQHHSTDLHLPRVLDLYLPQRP